MAASTPKATALVELFRRTEKAHQAARGEDGAEDWALWYAKRLHPELPDLLGVSLKLSDIVVCLLAAHSELVARDLDTPWPEYFAAHFLERLAVNDDTEEKLALYYFDTCPFCRMVLRALDNLDVEVEMRDIYGDPRHRKDLVAARGRPTVPVLRITTAEGDRWMPESRDIVRYLRTKYGTSST